jgi:hypothetical protein
VQLLYSAAFAGFIALGVAVRRAPPGVRRRRVLTLIAYVVAVNLLAGLTQRDAWPFTSHTIAVGRARATTRVCLTELVGVDGAGREWEVDRYSWMPMFGSVVQYWVDLNLAQLSAQDRKTALWFLLRNAEGSRARLAAGEPIGHQRWLGPLAAPYWLLLPRAAVSPAPFAGLRVYSSCRVPGDPADRGTRRLLAEHLEGRS